MLCTLSSNLEHTPDILLIHIFVKPVIKVLPPLKEHRFANELEPRSEFEVWFLEHLLQPSCRHVTRILNLIWAGLEIDIGFDEENIIHYQTSQCVQLHRDYKTDFRALPTSRNLKPCSGFW